MIEFKDLVGCILTGERILSKDESNRYFSYTINFGGKDYSFSFCRKCFIQIQNNLKDRKYLVQGLLLNGKLPEIEESVIHWEEDPHFNDPKDPRLSLKKELDEGIYPRNPKDKFDYLFSSLFKDYRFDSFSLNELKGNKIFLRKNYFTKDAELTVYIDALISEKLIDESSRMEKDGIAPYNKNEYRITYQGLTYLKKIIEDGFNSSKCFVAMAFQDETKLIRESIRMALLSTGFEPIFIDEKHISSEKTINDEIIANLKKCKFCIADFSHHKNGVYFESGFALGQGKPVIYTCEKEEFKKAHFDIKPLQHIIYSTPDELKQALISKIEAWIK